jgi:hypothetical protein
MFLPQCQWPSFTPIENNGQYGVNPCNIKYIVLYKYRKNNSQLIIFTILMYRVSSTVRHSTFVQPALLYIIISHPKPSFVSQIWTYIHSWKHFKLSLSGTVKLSPEPYFVLSNARKTNPSGCTVQGVGLRPLTCWDCGFKCQQVHGCMSLVSVVCCQVQVSVMSLPLIQSPTEGGVV